MDLPTNCYVKLEYCELEKVPDDPEVQFHSGHTESKGKSESGKSFLTVMLIPHYALSVRQYDSYQLSESCISRLLKSQAPDQVKYLNEIPK